MTTYKVGPLGATIYDEHGQKVARLRPGLVVVEGVEEPGPRPTGSVRRLDTYADKRVRAYEDKSERGGR